MKILTPLQVAPADTLNNIQAEIAAVAQKIATTPTNELISEFIDKAVAFGLKVFAALFIYTLGVWIIRKIKKIIRSIFERKQTDAAIASFAMSITSIENFIVLLMRLFLLTQK